MNKEAGITIKGKSGIMNVPDVGVFSFYTGAATTDDVWDTIILSDSGVQWEADPDLVAGKHIVPYGANNNLPVVVRDLMEANNLAPGILEREMGLLHGQGPQLYIDLVKEGDITRTWTYDQEIWDWLKSWNYRRFLDMATVEYKYLKGVFVKRFLRRGVRIGRKPEFVLEVCPGTDARLAWVDTRRLEDVPYIYTGDFENGCRRTGIRAWPVWDRYQPFEQSSCMSYHNSYSFAHNFYSIPGFWGSRKWIARSSDVPDILKYLSDNGLGLSHHIHSPGAYWEQKRRMLEERFPSKTDAEIDAKLEELKLETFRKISGVLAGKKNVGKFIETVDFWDDEAGAMVSWKIEPLEQNIKEFIDAQLAISDKADAATTSGIGLHPALSNMMMNGKSAAGSEMLYALKLYLASDTTIPEEVIFEPINQCIEAMWPGKKARLGFYHKIVMKEENVSPSERTTTNV
jgi:hypothetical protein